ncbi:hypothetical protein DYBT9275_02330 [Dyadobacter sp. CECT 9275]|uniref:Alpha glucuronidase N-terminal domain-containing protein n=1 Tax=Dyadobacter helix TaxID=2822344 RepID=A0A916NBS6_9BACT|nr:DUF4838 domain-containing protein [Dyadobacter sp. CECT 9275]CAG4999865.1 hypothetical protein DYBT9275_02330 [Dyadobacter sp. CECT 9275]
MNYPTNYPSNRFRSFLAVLAIATVLLNACSKNSKLISGGKSDYKIFVSRTATAPEKNAAAELKKYLKQISGCDLEITEEVKPEEKRIYIGFKEAPLSIVKDLDTAAFGNEEFIIRSDGENLLIAGGNTRGTLYGVVSYLSDYLGCRWYTREVVKIPSRETIELSQIEDRQKPALEYRQPHYREAYDTTWALHNRLNSYNMPASLGGGYVIFPFVHTFNQLVPPEKYFGAHPEYFSEVDGKRAISQLCLTNPEVVKIAKATVFEWIKTHPEANVFSIDQNDFGGYCTCKNCKELDEKEGSQSGTLIHFVNQIADTVAKVHPAIQLQTLAYDYTEVPPKTLRPADNVMIRLCHYDYCSAHPLGKCEDHKRYIDRLEQWKKISKKITIWDYYTQFAKYLMPFPNFETVKHDVKFYADRGVVGLFAQGNNVPDNGNGEFTELRAWVFAQLMWNPELDGQKLIDEYVENVYGDASGYINAYIKLLHDQVKPESTYFSIWEEPEDVNYLGLKTIQKADSLFALAKEVSAKDTALLRRVERAYLPVVYTKLYFHSMGGTAYIEEGKLPETVAYFKKLIAANQITQIAERADWGSIQAFLTRVESADQYLTDWHIIGPFDNAERKGFATVYPPEEQFDTTQTYTGKNGAQVKWRAYSDKSLGYINFAKLFQDNKDAVSYAYRNIHADAPKTIKLGVGSNDGVRVWVNGKLVLDRLVSRTATPNDDLITVPLKKGNNSLLVKVDQTGNKWGFYLTAKP